MFGAKLVAMNALELAVKGESWCEDEESVSKRLILRIEGMTATARLSTDSTVEPLLSFFG